MKATARRLILNTLLATEGRGQTVRAAIASCALFGIRENSVRVALVRLAAEGLIEPAGRGAYRLGPRAAALAEDVVTWRTAEERVREWNGAWIAVHVGALGRSDRVALRTRERALNLLGLRELDRGLHVRPDNLVGGVAGVRERLGRLGLDGGAVVFIASDFDAGHETRARRLWDGKALTRAYRSTRLELERWLERRDTVEPRIAARDAYLIGNDAIRLLVFDPLLPAPLVNVDERRALGATAHRVDEAGRAVWRRLRLTPDDDDFILAPPIGFELTATASRT